MNNFFTYIYFSWDIHFMAAPTTLCCCYFKTTEKVSWKAKKWIRQNLTFDNNSGRLDIEISKPLGLIKVELRIFSLFSSLISFVFEVEHWLFLFSIINSAKPILLWAFCHSICNCLIILTRKVDKISWNFGKPIYLPSRSFLAFTLELQLLGESEI